MSRAFHTVAFATVCVAASATWFGVAWEPKVDATVGGAYDADGDLLPCDVERTLLMDPDSADSDNDGIGDFLAAVTNVPINPFDDNEPIDPIADGSGYGSNSGIYDHDARVVISSRPDADGTDAIWMHLLIRFAGPVLPNVQLIDPWVDYLGIRTSLSSLIVTSPSELAFADAGADGIFVRLSLRVGTHAQMMVFSPATLGATFIIGGKTVVSGMTAININGHVAALTPVSSTSFTVVRLDDDDDPFWTMNRVCQIRLSIVTSTTTGHVCTISSARCRPAGNLRCPPGCLTSTGQTVFVPDGLSTINGGG
ncbi:MAG: hypothetical protein KDB80_00105 [Planctomycetes bacterium]|nr:hypothetical protein [Planctomycetota bacterium]